MHPSALSIPTKAPSITRKPYLMESTLAILGNSNHTVNPPQLNHKSRPLPDINFTLYTQVSYTCTHQKIEIDFQFKLIRINPNLTVQRPKKSQSANAYACSLLQRNNCHLLLILSAPHVSYCMLLTTHNRVGKVVFYINLIFNFNLLVVSAGTDHFVITDVIQKYTLVNYNSIVHHPTGRSAKRKLL